MNKTEALQLVFNKRIIALAKLYSVAEKVNQGWMPDWLDETQEKFYIATDFKDISVQVRKKYASTGMTFFKSREAAEEALKSVDVDILFGNLDEHIKYIPSPSLLGGEFVLIPTSDEVYKAAIDVMKLDGFVTTLELKTFLRTRGLFMTQELASVALEEVAKKYNWSYEMDPSNTFRIYSPKFF